MKSDPAQPPFSTFSSLATKPSSPSLISSLRLSSAVDSRTWNLLSLVSSVMIISARPSPKAGCQPMMAAMSPSRGATKIVG
jgi:hypothetical protein